MSGGRRSADQWGEKRKKNRGVEGGGVLGRSFRYEFMSLAPGWNAERGILVLTLG